MGHSTGWSLHSFFFFGGMLVNLFCKTRSVNCVRKGSCVLIVKVSAVLVLLYVTIDTCRSGVCEGHHTDVPWTGMYTVGVRQFDGSSSMRRWVMQFTSLRVLIREHR
jgi:hypothetical protein